MIIFLGRPHPKRLLAFFLAGAWLVSLTIGLVAVFAMDGVELRSSTRGAVNAAVYISIGAFVLVVGGYLLGRPPKPKKPKKDEKPSMTQRVLTKDNSWLVFVLGIVLNMPGVWYLIALKDIAAADQSTATVVAQVLLYNVIMFAAAEIPLLGFVFAPEATARRVQAFDAWLGRNGARIAQILCGVAGVVFVTRGIAGLA